MRWKWTLKEYCSLFKKKYATLWSFLNTCIFDIRVEVDIIATSWNNRYSLFIARSVLSKFLLTRIRRYEVADRSHWRGWAENFSKGDDSISFLRLTASRVRGQERTAELKVVVSKTKLRAWLRIPMLHIPPPRSPHFSHVGITCTRMVTDFTWTKPLLLSIFHSLRFKEKNEV